MNSADSLLSALWRIYNRPSVPIPWSEGDGNLPWNDPGFSERMLREHLTQTHSAASRKDEERALQIAWLWEKLALHPEANLLDMTCGPGLYAAAFAQRGGRVTGIDFSPASIAYAQTLAEEMHLQERVTFREEDVRQTEIGTAQYDAAVFLYGQITVFKKEEALALLQKIYQGLKNGGKLCLEVLNPQHIDKENMTWWYTAHKGLWGDTPFLHLGERTWLSAEKITVERFYTLHLETGKLLEIELCDQSYEVGEMVAVLHAAGFSNIDVYPSWAEIALPDKDKWIVYIAHK